MNVTEVTINIKGRLNPTRVRGEGTQAIKRAIWGAIHQPVEFTDIERALSASELHTIKNTRGESLYRLTIYPFGTKWASAWCVVNNG